MNRKSTFYSKLKEHFGIAGIIATIIGTTALILQLTVIDRKNDDIKDLKEKIELMGKPQKETKDLMEKQLKVPQTSNLSFDKSKEIERKNNEIAKLKERIDLMEKQLKAPQTSNLSFENNEETKREKIILDPVRIKEIVLFEETFENGLNDWNRLSENGKIEIINDVDRGKILKISRVDNNNITWIQRNIPRELIAGKNIRIQCMVKADEIKKGSEWYYDGKLVLKYNIGDRNVYNTSISIDGTFDWKLISIEEDGKILGDETNIYNVIYISNASQHCLLYLGLERCTGSIYFDDLKIIEIIEE